MTQTCCRICPGVLLVVASGAGLVAAAFLGPAGGDADRLLRGLLLPALGFVNIYFMEYSLVADHWQYAAMIVPCAVFAGVAATLGRRRLESFGWRIRCVCRCRPSWRALTWRQSRMYTDVETLYRATIAENPDCWMAYNNLGAILVDQGRVDKAIAHFQRMLASIPTRRCPLQPRRGSGRLRTGRPGHYPLSEGAGNQSRHTLRFITNRCGFGKARTV